MINRGIIRTKKSIGRWIPESLPVTREQIQTQWSLSEREEDDTETIGKHDSLTI